MTKQYFLTVLFEIRQMKARTETKQKLEVACNVTMKLNPFLNRITLQSVEYSLFTFVKTIKEQETQSGHGREGGGIFCAFLPLSNKIYGFIVNTRIK